MKKIFLSLILVSLCMGFPEIGHSAEQLTDGNAVLRDCSLAMDMVQDDYNKKIKRMKPMPSKKQQNDAMQCMNYVVGFKDALYVNQVYQEKSGKKSAICFPKDSIDNRQAVQVVVKYLKGNPILLSQPRAGLVFNAFFYAFYCGNNF